MYKERDEQKRAQFIAELEALPEETEFYYVDESGFDECYGREHGYAPRGEKVIGEISGKKFERTSIVAAKKGKDIFAPFAFKGTMDGDLFEGWLEDILVPELKNRENAVIILDNASSHKKDRVYEISERYGFNVIFLPPYSPDLNSIEKFWANVKKRLRQNMHKFLSFQDALSYAFK